MGELSAFTPAIPAMIVGHGHDDAALPLGLGEPFALLGGDKLGPDGIPFRVMHEHQPKFLAWVTESCSACLAAERPWFRGAPVWLTGPSGAGRTHAARWLARVAGAAARHSQPHRSGDRRQRRGLGTGRRGAMASPVTVAMTATRCANPVVTVLGADQVSDDVIAGLAWMMDPEGGVAWREDQLGVSVDLGEITWVLQGERMRVIPAMLEERLTSVSLMSPASSVDSVFGLSVMLEAMGDLGVDLSDPAFAWDPFWTQLPRRHVASAKALYTLMVEAIRQVGAALRPIPPVSPTAFRSDLDTKETTMLDQSSASTAAALVARGPAMPMRFYLVGEAERSTRRPAAVGDGRTSISVNGRWHALRGRTATFEQLLRIAFPTQLLASSAATVTYRRGVPTSPAGSLTSGDVVTLADGLLVNAIATYAS